MIAGNNRHLRWFTQFPQPGEGLLKLLGKAHMSEVAGDQQLVQFKLVEVTVQRRQYLAAMLEAAPAAPGEVAQSPFVEQFAGAHSLQRAEVGVGYLCEVLHGILRRVLRPA